MKEYILCAANRYDDGQKREFNPKNVRTGFVVCGRRHHNCISTFAQIVGFPYNDEAKRIMRTEVQGFITNTDRFVSRMEALKIAREANQIITEDGNDKIGLFSEDLY